MEIEAQIQQYISRNLLFSDGAFQYDNHDSFLQEGIIDSMGVMDLVTFVGSNFGVQVEPADVTPDNFDSVSKLAGFIRRKTKSLSTQPLPKQDAMSTPWKMVENSQSDQEISKSAR